MYIKSGQPFSSRAVNDPAIAAETNLFIPQRGPTLPRQDGTLKTNLIAEDKFMGGYLL